MRTHSAASDTPFSKELIYEQLQRIFQDPFFANSAILRRFLSFIIDETLDGHSSWLKEYTIGIAVLNKSVNFKPQENGIVRIHAGRLRRALNHYYSENANTDPVYITVPKGSYVPIFENSAESIKNNVDDSGKLHRHIGDEMLSEKPVAIAVFP